MGLKITKIFELLFRIVLSIPNQWLLIPDKDFNTAEGNSKIKILNAYNETGEITNKLKLFLRWYWENGGEDKAHETNGFDFRRYTDMLNSSLLYCSYLITDSAGNVNPDTFWNDVKRFMAEKQDNKYNVRFMQDGKEDVKKNLYLGHIDFQDGRDAAEVISVGGKSAEKSAGKSAGESVEETNEKSTTESVEETNEKSAGESVEETNEKSTTESNSIPVEQLEQLEDYPEISVSDIEDHSEDQTDHPDNLATTLTNQILSKIKN
jgi:hypothetical protein